MKRLYSLDPDHICTCSFNRSSHTVQEIGHIYYMRFFGCIFNDRLTFCHRCCHHDINGSAYSNYIQINMASHKSVCFSDDKSSLDPYISTKCTESLDMMVNGPAPDIASTGKCHLRLLELTKKCPQKIIRGPDLLNTVVLNDQTFNHACINLYCMSVQLLYSDAYAFHGFQHCRCVTEIRHIFYHYGFFRHGCCRKDRKCRILRTADLYLANQRIAALDCILFHCIPSIYIKIKRKISLSEPGDTLWAHCTLVLSITYFRIL